MFFFGKFVTRALHAQNQRRYPPLSHPSWSARSIARPPRRTILGHKKDLGSWLIAKGEYEDGEDPLQAALREFSEETGYRPAGPFLPLTQRKQASGKFVDAWATESDWNTSQLVSNTFSMEWPKGSGRVRKFPEVDRAEWFEISEAIRRINPTQAGFIDELVEKLIC